MKCASRLILTALIVAHSFVLTELSLAQSANLAVETTTPAVGQPFALQIQVEGSNVRPPAVLEIDSLDLVRTGQSTSVQIVNGNVTRTALYNYQATATKEGSLNIPSINLGQGTSKLSTKPLTLNVKKGNLQPQPRLGPGVPSPPGAPSQQQQAMPAIDDKSVFLKVVPEREQVYVGEAVEVKVKAYLDARIPLTDFERQITLQGEDFVFQTPVGPDVQLRNQRGRRVYVCKQERIDDQTFNVLTFRSSLTAVKPGTFIIAPLTYNATISIPSQRKPRSRRNAFDSFFGGNPFDDPFFDSVRSKKRLQLKSKDVSIEVLPLPSDGRPEHFSGAIGRFSMDVKPDKPALKVDEALTMTTTITGHGNFERISEVDIDEHAAWRAYPPKILFKSADELGLSGEKTFENTFIANEQTDNAPKIRFSYFDPQSKKYVSLESKDTLIMVTGTKAALKSPLAEASALLPSLTDVPAPILSATHTVNFVRGGSPLLASVGFLSINGIGLASLIGLLIWQKRQAPRKLSAKQQRRQLTAQRDAALQQLSSSNDPKAFTNAAMSLLAKTATLQETPIDVLPLDVEGRESMIATDFVSRLSDSEHKQILESLLDWSNAMQWSNGSSADADTWNIHRNTWIQALRAVGAPQS